ncbi:hypothetical protein E3Q12_00914 [Wallemia mellicola]|nr:hypothetical protein E3Q12_00914 [Wallemia mellicola]
MKLWSSDLCCCAIPMVNFGIYAQLFEFIAVGLAAGIVALASQRVLGAESVPEWPSYILGVLCLLVVIIQPIGFVGVAKEKFRLFRRFHFLNTLLTLCAFMCALAIIIACAAKHSDATTKCQSDYYPPDPDATFTLSQYSGTICNILGWVDIGVMGLLWVLLILVQGYFLWIQRKFSSGQRSGKPRYHYQKVHLSDDEIDHQKVKVDSYESVYHSNNGDDYMMSTHRDNAWDARNSYDAYAHDSSSNSYTQGYDNSSSYQQQPYAYNNQTHYQQPYEQDDVYNYNYSPQYKDSPYTKAHLPYGARY